MPIVHIKKHENNFVQIDKRPLSDERLSWKAKGLWTYLMSKPPDWKVYVAELAKRSTDGEHAIRSAMKELINFGYAERKALRENGKISEWVFYVYEQPVSPDRDFQHLENLHVENLPLNKNKDSKNEDIDSSAHADSSPDCSFFSGIANGGTNENGSQPAVQPKKKSAYALTMERLEQAFAGERSGGKLLPDWASNPKEANKRWRTPLKRMWIKTGKDTDLTEQLVIKATKQLKQSNMTFDAPDQIEKTFGSLLTDRLDKQAQPAPQVVTAPVEDDRQAINPDQIKSLRQQIGV